MGNSESSAPTSSENLVSEVSAGVESTSLNSNSLSQDHDIESLTEKIRELESMHSDALAVLGTSRDELAELIKQTEEKLSTNELEHRAQIQHLEETLGAKHKERKAALIAQKSAELNCDLDEVRGVALVERSVMFKEDLRSQAIGDLNRRWKIMEGELKAQFSRDYEQACRFSRDEHQKVPLHLDKCCSAISLVLIAQVFDNRTAPLLERIKELDEQVSISNEVVSYFVM